MPYSPSPVPRLQFFDSNGNPLAGGKLFVYDAGTLTPATNYVDAAGTATNSFPIILDTRGEADVWLAPGSYKYKLTDENDVEIWTRDNIPGPSA